MLAAGLLARKARRARAWSRKPWVKTSLAPGSKVVTEYLDARGPDSSRSTRSASTSSATAARPASATPARCRRRSRDAVEERATSRSCSVLSGNRNFEGRINPDVKMNYLASPPLVVAYALAGTMDIDLVERAARPGRRTATTSTCKRHLADRSRRSPRRSSRPCSRRCSASRYGERLRGRRALERRSRCPSGDASRGTTTRPTCASRRSSRACRPSPTRARRTSRARACSRCSATR